MTYNTPLSEASAKLIGSVRAGRYRDALAEVDEYRKRFDEALALVPAGAPERRRMVAEAAELLRWVKHEVVVGRSHAQTREGRAAKTMNYTRRDEPAAPHWGASL